MLCSLVKVRTLLIIFINQYLVDGDDRFAVRGDMDSKTEVFAVCRKSMDRCLLVKNSVDLSVDAVYVSVYKLRYHIFLCKVFVFTELSWFTSFAGCE